MAKRKLRKITARVRAVLHNQAEWDGHGARYLPLDHRMHGGRLWVVNTETCGATVSFTLRLAAQPDSHSHTARREEFEETPGVDPAMSYSIVAPANAPSSDSSAAT